MKWLALTVGLLLGACTTAQQDKIAELCSRAMPLAVLAAPIPIVGPYIASGVSVGCGTAEGLARLRGDANSAVWLGEQIGLLRAALGK